MIFIYISSGIPYEKFISESWLNHLLNLSEFQLNQMIPSISELLLKLGQIHSIFRKILMRFRKIQICISEKFRTKNYANLNLG